MRNNNKKIIVLSIIAILVFGGIVWFARPGSEKKVVTPDSSSAALAVIGERNFDFGKISMAAGDMKYVFKVKNITDAPIILNKMYTSCMCTAATLLIGDKKFGPYGMPGHGGSAPAINQTAQVNEEFNVEVVFDPAAHGPAGVGKIQRSVVLENSGGDPIEFQFSATVAP